MRNSKIHLCVLLAAFFALLGCSTPTSSESGGLDCTNCTSKKSSASAPTSSSSEESSSSKEFAMTWIDVSDFKISQTEVIQSDYKLVMDTLPVQLAYGDSLPVSNVSFYDAILFCNALSKELGYDTAYSYTARGAGNKLVDLKVNLTIAAVRLPNEEDWQFAAQAGSSEKYYWGTDVASKYAQYILKDGYVKVAEKIPNAWNLYDVAGNVSEWTNDTSLCGGSWRSTAKELALDESTKKNPDFASYETGIRVILTGELE